MDPIMAARELGRTIQQDPRYLRMQIAQQNNDEDTALQESIDSFNLLRTKLGAEVQKQDKDTDLIREMDAELKEKYQQIFQNENMREFTSAREDVQEMVTFINQIITGSVGGQDPDTIEFQQGCGGDCGGCSGCS